MKTILTEEQIEMIGEAIQLIEEARAIVDNALEGATRHMKSHYRAYGCYGFDQLLGNGNPYDSSLFSLMEEKEDE